MNKKMILQISLILTILATIFCSSYIFSEVTPSDIQSKLLSFNRLSPIILVSLFIIRPFIFFPASILAVAAGLTFGPIYGSLIAYFGSLCGASLSFIVGRKLKGNFKISRWSGDRVEKLQKKIEEDGFYLVFIMRILPVINFDFVSYVSGLSKVRFKQYILGTIVGIIPGTITLNLIGASLVTMNWKLILLTSLLLLTTFTISILVRKRLFQKNLLLQFFFGSKN
ncbi:MULTISPECIES: TVP38/TMEM64 family protein [Bacillaceae]|uniref:TVP38/TMEM64 family membrane protein n=1 Tax=Evansella alkalicola TaxID=745819 RepID=A0ABS6JN02_9BACI|nr:MULTISPECIES: TVP38/TMEM64 family protein [Bacillaceae]MBU9719936.1 TVP38/TMEM64 family protein [Bacillus alkalicola]